MATWQFWVLIAAMMFGFSWVATAITTRMSVIGMLLVNLDEQLKMIQGNTFRCECHLETLARNVETGG